MYIPPFVIYIIVNYNLLPSSYIYVYIPHHFPRHKAPQWLPPAAVRPARGAARSAPGHVDLAIDGGFDNV